MDIFSPKIVIGGAILAFASATVNTGMFSWVSNDVQDNKEALQKQEVIITKHTEQIETIDKRQEEIYSDVKIIRSWVDQQKGKENSD